MSEPPDPAFARAVFAARAARETEQRAALHPAQRWFEAAEPWVLGGAMLLGPGVALVRWLLTWLR